LSPLLLIIKNDKAEELQKNIDEFLQDTDIFVVDIKVKTGNNITVLLDRDSTGIRIEDCVAVTRHIESNTIVILKIIT
jgi:ribosome maturation factor RimP